MNLKLKTVETDFKKMLQLLKIEITEDSLKFERGKVKFYKNICELKAHISDILEDIETALFNPDNRISIEAVEKAYIKFSNNLLKTLEEHEELRNRYK